MARKRTIRLANSSTKKDSDRVGKCRRVGGRFHLSKHDARFYYIAGECITQRLDVSVSFGGNGWLVVVHRYLSMDEDMPLCLNFHRQKRKTYP